MVRKYTYTVAFDEIWYEYHIYEDDELVEFANGYATPEAAQFAAKAEIAFYEQLQALKIGKYPDYSVLTCPE